MNAEKDSTIPMITIAAKRLRNGTWVRCRYLLSRRLCICSYPCSPNEVCLRACRLEEVYCAASLSVACIICCWILAIMISLFNNGSAWFVTARTAAVKSVCFNKIYPATVPDNDMSVTSHHCSKITAPKMRSEADCLARRAGSACPVGSQLA